MLEKLLVKKLIAKYKGIGNGNNELIAGDRDIGWFGPVDEDDHFNQAISDGLANYFDGEDIVLAPIAGNKWHKFVYNGQIIYVPINPVGMVSHLTLFNTGTLTHYVNDVLHLGISGLQSQEATIDYTDRNGITHVYGLRTMYSTDHPAGPSILEGSLNASTAGEYGNLWLPFVNMSFSGPNWPTDLYTQGDESFIKSNFVIADRINTLELIGTSQLSGVKLSDAVNVKYGYRPVLQYLGTRPQIPYTVPPPSANQFAARMPNSIRTDADNNSMPSIEFIESQFADVTPFIDTRITVAAPVVTRPRNDVAPIYITVTPEET